jgi:hypothetical protein
MIFGRDRHAHVNIIVDNHLALGIVEATARQKADGFIIDGVTYLKNDRVEGWFPSNQDRLTLREVRIFRTERSDTRFHTSLTRLFSFDLASQCLVRARKLTLLFFVLALTFWMTEPAVSLSRARPPLLVRRAAVPCAPMRKVC